MPTGGSETAADRTLGGLIKDNQQTHFQLSRRQKRSRCAGPLQIIREDTIIIHQVKVGSHVVRTVVAAVAPDGASALLPITVLKQIGKFTIDFANNKLSFN